MSLFGIGEVADLVKEILAFFPNAEQRAQVASKLQDLELAIANNQAATNTAEATTGSIFLAGWRPFVGWVAALGFTYSIGLPIFHGQPLDTQTLNNLLWGMLGLGAYRSGEKIAGVATKALKRVLGQ